MADAALPTRDRVEGYFKELNNWGRWGHDDQLGTVNLITPAKQAQAQRLIKKGRTVSLARDVIPRPVYMYHMTFPSKRERVDVVLDRFDMVYHGFWITHVDALCHVGWDGELYNGRSFADSLTIEGALWCPIDPIFERGITTRGVFLDIAAGRKEGYVTVGHPVTPRELDEAERRAGVKVEPGDVVVVRSGDEKFRLENPDWKPRISEQPGLRHVRAPGDPVPRARPDRQLRPRTPREGLRRGRAQRVPVHRHPAPSGRRHGRAGAPARDLLIAARGGAGVVDHARAPRGDAERLERVVHPLLRAVNTPT